MGRGWGVCETEIGLRRVGWVLESDKVWFVFDFYKSG